MKAIDEPPYQDIGDLFRGDSKLQSKMIKNSWSWGLQVLQVGTRKGPMCDREHRTKCSRIPAQVTGRTRFLDFLQRSLRFLGFSSLQLLLASLSIVILEVLLLYLSVPIKVTS